MELAVELFKAAELVVRIYMLEQWVITTGEAVVPSMQTLQHSTSCVRMLLPA